MIGTDRRWRVTRRPVMTMAFGVSAVALLLVTWMPALAARDEADGPLPSPPAVPLAERLEARITVPGSPDWPTAAFDSIWVLAPDLPLKEEGGTPNLVRIDPVTNDVVATIEIPDRLCQGFVASEDAIWVCAADALIRVDPVTDEIVSTVSVVGARKWYRPAYGGDRVWALGSGAFTGDTVIALDPTTETTTTYSLGAPAGGLAYAFDALWLTIPSTGSVVRLDPATGSVDELVTGLATPTGITSGVGDLWVSLYGTDEEQAGAGDPQLARIDPESGEVLAELAIGGSPRGGVDVWAGEEGVLVRSTMPWLTRVDPETNSIIETVDAGPDVSAIQGPMTVAFGSIWTVNIEEDSIFRLSRS
jgi:streptogramin lyase